MKDSKQGELIIFSHILKTGGLAFSNIMQRQYKPNFFMATQEPFKVRKEINQLKKITKDSDNRIRAVSGHIGIGLHELLPQPSKYITILRDPIDRLLSQYYHCCRGGLVLPIKDFVSMQPRFSYNLQTRFLSGFEFNEQLTGAWDANSFFDVDLDYYRAKCTTATLESAKVNLKERGYFGLTERFEESLLMFKQNLGWKWKNIWYIKTNIGTNRPHNEVISDDILECLQKVNELDAELYRYAKENFEEQIKVSSTIFKRNILMFKKLNSAIAQVHPYAKSLRQKFSSV